MKNWLARIAADIKRANKWLDPSYVPKPSWQPRCTVESLTWTWGKTYRWTEKR